MMYPNVLSCYYDVMLYDVMLYDVMLYDVYTTFQMTFYQNDLS